MSDSVARRNFEHGIPHFCDQPGCYVMDEHSHSRRAKVPVSPAEWFPRVGSRLYCWRALSETLALMGFLYLTRSLVESGFGLQSARWWWFIPLQLLVWFGLRRWFKGSWFRFQERGSAR